MYLLQGRKIMKKLLLLAALIPTISIADTAHCDATLTRGYITMTTLDTVTNSGVRAHVNVIYDMQFLNPFGWQQPDYFRVFFNSDLEGMQHTEYDDFINPVSNHASHQNYFVQVPSISEKGRHVYMFEIDVPRYNCKVISSSIIEVL